MCGGLLELLTIDARLAEHIIAWRLDNPGPVTATIEENDLLCITTPNKSTLSIEPEYWAWKPEVVN